MKHLEAIKTLKVAKGQLDFVLDMLAEEKYCIDISNQLQAVISLAKKAQKQILSEHLHHCVRQSFEDHNPEEKIQEIEQLLNRIL